LKDWANELIDAANEKRVLLLREKKILIKWQKLIKHLVIING